ncbi:hypothetical protein HOH87_04050 [bacterium]|nr:hypothetical protein [bacterium]
MNREISFYCIVSGLCLYGLLLGVTYAAYIPMIITNPINTEPLILPGILCLFLLPIALFLTNIANNYLNFFPRKWLFIIGPLPLLVPFLSIPFLS